MSCVDEQSYKEVITRLRSFINDVERVCQAMEHTGQDCLAGMRRDSNATAAYQKLNGYITLIRDNFGAVEAVEKALHKELDMIQNINSTVSD